MHLNDLTYFYCPLPLCLRIGSLQQFPSTLDFINLAGAYRGGIAALAAVRTTRNACTADRRKLVCTDGRSAERQRAVEGSQIVSQQQWRRAKQCRHAGHSHSPGAAPLRAASRQCNFLWVGLREGYLFFKKRYPSLISHPHTVWGTFPNVYFLNLFSVSAMMLCFRSTLTST